MHTFTFLGVGIPLMEDIPVYGMMEKLHRSYPERCDELVDMLGIDLNWIMHQLSDSNWRQTCADSDWSDTTISRCFYYMR